MLPNIGCPASPCFLITPRSASARSHIEALYVVPRARRLHARSETAARAPKQRRTLRGAKVAARGNNLMHWRLACRHAMRKTRIQRAMGGAITLVTQPR